MFEESRNGERLFAILNKVKRSVSCKGQLVQSFIDCCCRFFVFRDQWNALMTCQQVRKSILEMMCCIGDSLLKRRIFFYHPFSSHEESNMTDKLDPHCFL